MSVSQLRGGSVPGFQRGCGTQAAFCVSMWPSVYVQALEGVGERAPVSPLAASAATVPPQDKWHKQG